MNMCIYIYTYLYLYSQSQMCIYIYIYVQYVMYIYIHHSSSVYSIYASANRIHSFVFYIVKCLHRQQACSIYLVHSLICGLEGHCKISGQDCLFLLQVPVPTIGSNSLDSLLF